MSDNPIEEGLLVSAGVDIWEGNHLIRAGTKGIVTDITYSSSVFPYTTVEIASFDVLFENGILGEFTHTDDLIILDASK